jgi:adenosylhomocysteine nucleosidase
MTGLGFIGVVCGLKSEAQVVAAVLDASKIRVGISGANAARAEDIAVSLCNQGASAIISIGVSGGLDPTLQPGDLIIGETIVADDGAVYESDRFLLGCIISAHSRESGDERGEGFDANIKAVTGPLFGSDEIIESAGKKAALFQNHGAIAVDMESHGAACAAAQAGVPFLAIRAIADPADRALPPAALGAIAPDGSTRMLATLGAAMRDPKQLPALMKLGADSAAALKALRRDLGPLFGGLFLSLDL